MKKRRDVPPRRIAGMISPPWRVALFLFFAAGLNYADRTALSSVIPPLREELGATDVQIGLAGMLFLWSYALVSPFAGNFADRFSRRKIIVGSLVAWSLLTVFTGMTHSMVWLLGLRVALGVAESFYLPASGALLGEHHGAATLGKAMGLHMLGLNFGLIVGGSFAGLMAEHYGWRLGFWILGGLGLLLAVVSPFFLKDGSTRPAENAARIPPPSKARALEAWSYLLRTPSYHCMLFSAVAAGVASWIFLSWLPLFFAESYGMNLGAAGLTGVLLYKGPVFVGIALGGWLSDKVVRSNPRGRVLIKGLSFIVSAPFLFLFMSTPGFALLASAMLVSTIIRAVGVPSEHPIICEVVPSRFRASAIGILNTCGAGAGGIGVLLAGVFKQDFGLHVIFGASSLLYTLAGLVMLLSYWFWMAKDIARASTYQTPPGDLAPATRP